MPDLRHKLILKKPATRWEEAFPNGNGLVGALTYGGIYDDNIVFNHHGLFLPVHSKEPLVDISGAFSEVRRLTLEGKYFEACDVWKAASTPNGYARNYGHDVDPFIPMCRLKIRNKKNTFSGRIKNDVKNYQRTLCMDTGVTAVCWNDYNAEYRREMFISLKDNIAVYKISVINIKGDEPVKLRYDFSLIPQTIEESYDAPFTKIPFDYKQTADDKFLTFSGKFNDGREFGCVARVASFGGEQFKEDDYTVVRNSDEIILLIKFFTDGASKEEICRLENELSEITPDYTVLFNEHINIHNELYYRTQLELGSCDADNYDNETLVKCSEDGDTAASLVLFRKMFCFGRYMLITSSLNSKFPATLQGLWNGDYWPLWDSDYHTDENIEMTYWPALPGGLAETTLPYFDYFDLKIDDFRENAMKIFGCRGIYVPVIMTSTGLEKNGSDGHTWTAGAGWLAQLYFDYYLFTDDIEFLIKRSIPYLKECALFYNDFFIEGDDGKYISAPSHSPENKPSNTDCNLALNATMDFAIAKEILTNLIEACNITGICYEEKHHWEKMLIKIPDYSAEEDGALKEWLHPDLHNNDTHRHIAHLYPVFPGIEIIKEANPKVFGWAKKAIENRMKVNTHDRTSWALAHYASIFARIGDSESAYSCLVEMLGRPFAYYNFFMRHMPGFDLFQADANFGFTAAVLEMLLFSKPGVIKILPALPAVWLYGKATGLFCRGGITVSLEWDIKKNYINAILKSTKSQKIKLIFPFRSETDYKIIELNANVEKHITDCFHVFENKNN